MDLDVWTSACANGGCVEVKWLSMCSSGGCVEVAHDGGRVLVRDSKLGDESPVLEYSIQEWQEEVVDELRDGGWLPEYTFRSEDMVVMRRVPTGFELRFTEAEWDSFVDGVKAGKFEVPA